MTTSLAAASLRPLSRQATTKLAARRLTSHSQGAGRVSSRSLMEKMTLPLRSGEAAEVTQVGVPAALDADSGGRGGRQVGRHGEGRPAVERERGADHAPVAEGEQLR